MTVLRTAGCVCGQLTLTTEGEPERVGICHCMTCRKTTGSVFSVFVIFKSERVRIAGRYEGWHSSPENRRCFCPVCGSPVFETTGSAVEIKGGAFEPNTFAPSYEIWTVRREHWLPDTGLPSFPENRGGP